MERQEFRQQELQGSAEQALIKFQTLTAAAVVAVGFVAVAVVELMAAELVAAQERAECQSTMTRHLLHCLLLHTLAESMDMRMLEKCSTTAQELAMHQAEVMADSRRNGEDVFSASAMKCQLMICRPLISFV
jgi:hypothetical protein